MTDEELQALKEAEEAAAKEAAELEALEAKKKADEEAAKNKSKTPTDAEAKLLKEVMAAKAKLKAAEDARKELEAKYSGIDLEQVNKLMQEREEAENKELERKGEYDRLIAKQKEAHAKEREELQARIKELSEATQNASKNIEALTVGSAFANSRFVLDNLTLTPNKAKALYGEHFEFEDGAIVAYDKPRGSANRTKMIDGSGDSLSFDEAMKQIIDADPDKETLIRATQKQGAGSKETKINERNINRNKAELSPFDKMLAGLKESKLVD